MFISFWLSPTVSPVQVGVVPDHLVGAWATAPTTPVGVASDLARQSATITAPDGPAHVRLDFDLLASIAGRTASVLSFRQHFMVTLSSAPAGTRAGALVPVQFSFDDSVLVASPQGPQRVKGPSPNVKCSKDAPIAGEVEAMQNKGLDDLFLPAGTPLLRIFE